RLQQAVAEHVAGHVADADRREVLRLRIDAELTEVPLDALPAAARSDAHLLVVVTRRAAGCERVAEPEVVFGRDAIRDVGEGRGAFVGSDDQVWIVVIATHDLWRRHELAVDDVVGDVEQAADESAIALDTFALHVFAARIRGQALRHEAAFGADRDDHRVLDVLRLHQAEHFGAEVFAPIGPADAAAR